MDGAAICCRKRPGATGPPCSLVEGGGTAFVWRRFAAGTAGGAFLKGAFFRSVFVPRVPLRKGGEGGKEGAVTGTVVMMLLVVLLMMVQMVWLMVWLVVFWMVLLMALRVLLLMMV